MPVDLKKLLRNALDEMESEEKRDALESRFRALEERRPSFSLTDFVSALENASDEELDALEGTVLEGLIRETVREGEDDTNGSKGAARVAGNEDEEEEKPKQKPRRTRPGRKSGAAYDWEIDDSGKVQKLRIPRVFSGEDEPDEVELPGEDDE